MTRYYTLSIRYVTTDTHSLKKKKGRSPFHAVRGNFGKFWSVSGQHNALFTNWRLSIRLIICVILPEHLSVQCVHEKYPETDMTHLFRKFNWQYGLGLSVLAHFTQLIHNIGPWMQQWHNPKAAICSYYHSWAQNITTTSDNFFFWSFPSRSVTIYK